MDSLAETAERGRAVVSIIEVSIKHICFQDDVAAIVKSKITHYDESNHTRSFPILKETITTFK